MVNMKGDKDLRICLIGGGDSIYTYDNTYYSRLEAVHDYLDYLENRSVLDYFAVENSIASPESHFSIPVPPERVHPQKTGGILRFLKSLFVNINAVYHLRDERPASLVYLPDVFGYLIFAILYIVSARTMVYYQSDTLEVCRNNSDVGWVTNVLYRTLDPHVLRLSDAVIYRDHQTKSRADDPEKCVRSRPLIPLSVGDCHERKGSIDEPVNVLFVGVLEERKNVGALIKAVESINREGVMEAQLTIVGDGPCRDHLQQIALDSNTDVHFSGFVHRRQELLDEYRSADVFVIPSAQEGFPRVITEAMSQSLPVITTMVGEIDEELSSNEALLIDDSNPETIANAIITLASNNEIRQGYIGAGIDRARRVLSESAQEQHFRILQGGLE